MVAGGHDPAHVTHGLGEPLVVGAVHESGATAVEPRRIRLGAAHLSVMREADVAARVAAGLAAGDGGWIVTVNIDILRAVTRTQELASLIGDATLTVADGMPLVWASRVAGDPLPARVTGASLVETLAAVTAAAGGSVYLLGGEPGVPDAAGEALMSRFPGLRLAGACSPPFGFDKDEEQVADAVRGVVASTPDLVLIGLGFPKQERLIAQLRPLLPRAWFLGCGAGIAFAAGTQRRAPDQVQRLGAEWVHRLALEPRRLAGRYLVHDMPFALTVLGRAAAHRVLTPGRSRIPAPRIPQPRAPQE